MLFDYDSVCLISGTFILAPLVAIIVGSQDGADAKAVADWTVGVLFVMLLADCARFIPARADYPIGGVGFVVFFSALILAVELGRRVATSRPPAPWLGCRGKEGVPDPWDDDLA